MVTFVCCIIFLHVCSTKLLCLWCCCCEYTLCGLGKSISFS